MKFEIGDTIKRKSYKRENYYSHRPLGFVWTTEPPSDMIYTIKSTKIIGIVRSEGELRLFACKPKNGTYRDIKIEHYDNARLLLTERL